MKIVGIIINISDNAIRPEKSQIRSDQRKSLAVTLESVRLPGLSSASTKTRKLFSHILPDSVFSSPIAGPKTIHFWAPTFKWVSPVKHLSQILRL